jgi:opacity protein-like surface antigen
MKKGLLALLLAVALVAPVFAADQGAMELDIKAGFNLMSSVDIGGWDGDVDPAFTAGVDFFYYVMPELAIGAGAQYVFNADIDKAPIKAGWTNLYAQAKYVFDLGDDLFNNIYPLVQLGYSILRTDPDEDFVDSNGMYWGVGVGTTIKECVVFELLYSNGNSKFKDGPRPGVSDLKYKTVQLKVGYKFSF